MCPINGAMRLAKIRGLEVLQFQAGIPIKAGRDLPELRARLAGEIVTAQNPAPLAQGMPFAVPSAGEKGERGNAKERRDVHGTSVHGQDFLAPGDLTAQVVEGPLKTGG